MQNDDGTHITECRICGNTNLKKVLSLGNTPLANSFLTKEQLTQREASYPLELFFCENCGLLQIGFVVKPEIMYKNYVYVSSTSNTFVNHFKVFASEIFQRFKLSASSLVIDIGSNDGILLKPFKNLGARVLGIEPAENIAKIAEENGIETVTEFFNESLAKRIVAEKGKPKIITATNVFSHVHDLKSFILGVKELLADDGIFIFEVYYLKSMIQKNLFDLIYHEHLSYFCVKPLQELFEQFGLSIFDVQAVPTHGGSLRVFVKKSESDYPIQESVKNFLEEEINLRLNQIGTYIEFNKKIQENKELLTNLLKKLKSEGKTIVGYGAAAKSNTLLNYFGIGQEILEYIIDDSPLKQGLYTPGAHIPIVSADKMYNDKPDYVLILAWNFADDIIKRHSVYKNGGKFVIPVPEPKII